jgi:hypothetical protein
MSIHAIAVPPDNDNSGPSLYCAGINRIAQFKLDEGAILAPLYYNCCIKIKNIMQN